METKTEQFLNLIEIIYDAALRPDIWPEFANRVCRLIPSNDFNIYSQDLTTGKVCLSYTTTPPEEMQLYFERYHAINPFFPAGLQITRSGSVFRSEDLIDPNEFEKTEFYREFFSRLGLFHIVNTTILKEEDVMGSMTLSRSKELGAYTPDDIHLLKMLIPHLQRSFRIGNMFSVIDIERELLSNTLNKIQQGCLIVNQSSEMMFMNKSAQAILANKDGLFLDRRKRLQTTRAGDVNRLRKIIELSGRRAPELTVDCGGVVQLERPSGLRPLSLLIAPLDRETSQQWFYQSAVLIFITDPEKRVEAAEQALRQLYSLTSAEARVAAILMQGKNIVEASVELGVSQNTTRTHVKRIFEKTGAKRQSDLVKLLLHSPAIIKPSE